MVLRTNSDRLGIRRADRKIAVAIGYCVVSGVLLFAGFHSALGLPQLLLIGAGMFFAAGTSGPAMR